MFAGLESRLRKPAVLPPSNWRRSCKGCEQPSDPGVRHKVVERIEESLKPVHRSLVLILADRQQTLLKSQSVLGEQMKILKNRGSDQGQE